MVEANSMAAQRRRKALEYMMDDVGGVNGVSYVVVVAWEGLFTKTN